MMKTAARARRESIGKEMAAPPLMDSPSIPQAKSQDDKCSVECVSASL